MGKGTSRISIGEVRAKLRELEAPTSQTIRRFDEIIGRFESFAQRGFGIEFVGQVTAEHVEQFVRAKGSTGEPSIATMHLRRAALRLLFRIARVEFGHVGDPTLDLMLPPRSSMSARPLTDEEVVLGRSYSLHTLAATRQPAAWALGEATATTAELPHITIDDLNFEADDGPKVWLHGSRKRTPRWGYLDDWGVTQLERRASALRGTRYLIYQGNGSEESQQASCCIAIKETLIRAGLDSEPDVKPMSLVAWAGVSALDETERIEAVARRLGVRSLDAAAKLIGFDWQD